MKIKLGNINNREGKSPELEIVIEEEGKEDKIKGYLYPFRGYTFGVYGKDGNGAYGTAQVLGLGNIIAATEQYKGNESRSSIYASNLKYTDGGVARYIMYCMAVDALVNYSNNGGTQEGAHLELGYKDKEKLTEFIKMSYDHVKKIM